MLPLVMGSDEGLMLEARGSLEKYIDPQAPFGIQCEVLQTENEDPSPLCIHPSSLSDHFRAVSTASRLFWGHLLSGFSGSLLPRGPCQGSGCTCQVFGFFLAHPTASVLKHLLEAVAGLEGPWLCGRVLSTPWRWARVHLCSLAFALGPGGGCSELASA